MQTKNTQPNSKKVRWLIGFYDLLIYLASSYLAFFAFAGGEILSLEKTIAHIILCCAIVFIFRFVSGVYKQIWRYGGIQSYLRMLVSDGFGFIGYYFLQRILPIDSISFPRCFYLVSLYLLASLGARMLYRYVYKCLDCSTWYGKFLYSFFELIGATNFNATSSRVQKINVAIIGAGKIGISLADELLSSTLSAYEPVMFVDVSKEKIGREIHGIPVVSEESITIERLRSMRIQEVVLTVHQLPIEEKQKLYEKYKALGLKVKVYDTPLMDAAGKRTIREFDVDELLFRKPIIIESETANAFYKDKVVLITGGGGSIGSELCRQLAKMQSKELVIMDIYENGAYDIQQEININYANKIKVNIEIASVTDKEALERVFSEYKPQVVVMAAAHKHVPLMEKNCIEAVWNNVFGTLYTIEASEKYGAERVIMVSTDKAVNPTNVMGATKRMCEIIVKTHSSDEYRKKKGIKTTFSMTRFGNVLGSAGSVIPLFKRQIAHGGPVTITDKRIIRYFMTIPEASELVLISGAIAKNGELFVLDMGQPVKIYDLAQNMIKLSGAENIEIIETGLRPGEKLYEELLVKPEELEKTENEYIFIDSDAAISEAELESRLSELSKAISSNNDKLAKEALGKVVPTYTAF